MRPITKYASLHFRRNAHRVVIAGFLLLTIAVNQHSHAQAPSTISQQTVGQWIANLTNEDYLVRKQAEAKLRSAGLVAFEQLKTASRSDQVELKSAANRIMAHSQFRWVEDCQCKKVGRILAAYIAGDLPRQKFCIEHLASINDRDSVKALLNVCRYEPNPMSRIAAIALLRNLSSHFQLINPSANNELKRQILLHLKGATRTGCQWLLETCSTATQSDYSQLCDIELTRVESAPTLNPIDRNSSLELVQWFLTEQFIAHPNASTSIESRYLQCIRNEDLTSVLIWLESQNRHLAIDQVYRDRFDEVKKRPIAIYAIANSKQTRRDTLAVNNLMQLADQHISAHPIHRFQLAASLQHLGYSQFAKRNYQQTIDNSETNTAIHIQARLALANQLEQQFDFAEAHEQLRAAYNLVKDNAQIRRVAQRQCGVNTNQLQARCLLIQAKQKQAQQDSVGAIDLLLSAVQLAPKHSEILITLHHVASDYPDILPEVDRLVGLAIQELDSEIQSLTGQQIPLASARRSKLLDSKIAILLNRKAWLNVNTGARLEFATKAATLATELQPYEPAYLDTLAVCQFRQGDIQLAIETQSLASRLVPGNPKYQRRLEQLLRLRRERVLAQLPWVIQR